MLYQCLKIIVRLALKIFCRKIHITNALFLRQQGPLLLAVNHPNTFLDALIVGSLFSRPVYFLARGDAFGPSWARRILLALKTIPVYRLSEGKGNMGHNAATFRLCRQIFRNGGNVLIFSEGSCENEWGLRPLKKGTARLAIETWMEGQEGEKLKVLPVGMNYDSFRRFGKTVFVNIGDPIGRDDFDEIGPDGKLIRAFNDRLREALDPLVFRADEMAHRCRAGAAKKGAAGSFFIAALTFLPAVAGWIFNFPFYKMIKSITSAKTAGTVYYDGVLFSLLALLYPFYILVIVLALLFITGSGWWWALFILGPLSAWLLLIFRECMVRGQST